MRILHIVGSISPAAGGPTEAIRMLIEHQPAGFSAEVATLNDPAEPFLSTFPFKITALGSAKKSWYIPALTTWLRANKHRFDGVIVHGLWEYTGVAAHKALGRKGQHGYVPYVVFTHGMLDPYFKRAFPRKHAKKWVFWNLFQFQVLRDAHRVLFTTQLEETLAHDSFSRWNWKPLVVALGSEAPPEDTSQLLKAFYTRCPELEGKPFLLFLGRIDPKKGPDLLLQAFATVKPTGLHLAMAGPYAEGYRHDLETAILLNTDFLDSDRIHWPGMLTGDAKWGAIAACEAFVLTSHQENFGIAVVEALASGKPVLISDQINIAPDIAADGAGLVAPDTLDGARSLLQQWLKLTPEERTKMSAQALITFATRYDMRKNTATILEVFKSH